MPASSSQEVEVPTGHHLAQVEQAEELLMLSLRLSEGLDLEQAEQSGLSKKILLTRAKPMEKAGYLTVQDGKIALTDTGFLVSNSIIAALMDAL